jgi:hypothetical protein
LAEAAADQVQKDLSNGLFDEKCGSGRPRLLLTGHSKGGGLAQYAGARVQLDAIVYNSDMLTPLIFSDWLQTRQDNSVSSVFFDAFINPIVRRAQSVFGCLGQTDPRLRKFDKYFAKGKVIDVRMTNDPLTEWLYRACGNNLPHAPIKWLYNTSTCSADGHGMETVVRELKACAGRAQPPT